MHKTWRFSHAHLSKSPSNEAALQRLDLRTIANVFYSRFVIPESEKLKRNEHYHGFKCFICVEIWHMIYQNVWIFIMNVAKPCNNQFDIRPFKEIGNCYLVLTASNLQLSPNSLSSVIGIILNYKYRCRLIIICFNIT